MKWSLITCTQNEPRSRTIDEYERHEDAVAAAIRAVTTGASRKVNGEVILCRADRVRRPGEDWYFQSCLGHITVGFVGAVPAMPSLVNDATMVLLMAPSHAA